MKNLLSIILIFVFCAQARSNYTYKSFRRANNTIVTGSLVTPTTDQGDYVVEANVELVLEAGKEIVLKPGTHIKAGANVHLKIDPFLCQDSESGIQQNSDVAKSINLKLDDTTQIVMTDKVVKSELLIFPNPIKGVISVLNQQINEKEANEYTIYTLEGKEVEHGNIINMQIFTNLSRGVYLLKIKDGGEIKINKIAIE